MIRILQIAFVAVGLIWTEQRNDGLARALQLAQQEKYADAADIFRSILVRNPDDAEARYNLSLALMALGKPQEALSTLQGWRDASNTVPFRYLRGKLEASLNKDKDAEKDLVFAAEAKPEREPYVLDLGIFYIRHQSFVQAISTLKRGLRYHPDSVYILLSLALAQSFAGTADATETARRILKTNPEFGPARLVLAHALYMDGDYSGCEGETSTAVRAGNRNPYLFYLRAASRSKLNSTDWGDMLADLDTVQKSIPDCTICWLVRSKVDEARGDLSAAISDLEHIVSTHPSFRPAWSRLAMLYKRANRTKDSNRAREMYQRMRAKEELDGEKQLAERYLLSGGVP
ncbi:MAG: tetratricopeptide repeat protein [Bryobacteraceae bacterium]